MKRSEGEILSEFGEMFSREIRDSTLVRYEKIKKGELGSASAKALHTKLELLDKKSMLIVDELVLDIIDAALFRFLRLAEQEEIIISYNDCKNVADLSDGISGEIFGSDGWIALYSDFPPSER